MKLKISSQNKTIIVNLIFLLISVGIFTFSFNKFTESVLQTNALKTNLSQVKQQYADETQLLGKYVALQDSLKSYSDILPTQTTLVNWINQLEIMAQLTNITLTNTLENGQLTSNGIVIANPTDASNSTLQASLNLSGKFSDVMNYINLINNSYYYTQITNITFAQQGKTFDATVSLNLFITKPTTPTP